MSVIYVGHRGVAGTHPENTMVSVQQAHALGLQWIEVDIQPTKDDVLVVSHDHTVNRCSNGEGRIDELTLEQLSSLDFGAWKSDAFVQERIMTLVELLDFCHHHTMNINLEIKIDRHDPYHVVSLLKWVLDNHSFDREKLIISSFSSEVMLALFDAKLGVRLGVLTKRLNRKAIATIQNISAFSCHLDYKWLTANHINMLRELEVEIWCYTVNNPKLFRHLDKVDAIFTDYPARFTQPT